MGLDLGQLVIMVLRWSSGMALAIGFALLVAWVGDRCHQRWGTAGRRPAAPTDSDATRAVPAEPARSDNTPVRRS